MLIKSTCWTVLLERAPGGVRPDNARPGPGCLMLKFNGNPEEM